MRKAILATAFVAITAGVLAIGVTQSDKIKSLFTSQELYNRNGQTVDVALDNSASLTGQPLPQTETTVATAEAPGGMTPVDLDNVALNDQTPAAGEEAAKELDVAPLTEAPAATLAAAETPAATGTFQVDVQKSLENRSIGSASAPLTVHDFSSLTCPHCAHFHNEILPEIKKNYIDTGKVRWVFHSFPLNAPALKADMVARCAPNDQFLKLTDFMYSNQERWAFESQPLGNLSMLLKVAGVTDEIFQACSNNEELQTALIKAGQEATEKYKINSTPSFIFNDGMKVFSGAGDYKGFAYDLDNALNDLQAAKQTPAPALSAPVETEKK